MSDSSSSDPEVDTSKAATFFSKNGWWTTAAAFMTFIGIALVVVLVPTGEDGDSTGPSAATSPPPSAPLSTLPATESTPAQDGWQDLGCNGTKGATTIPNLPPKAKWEPVGVVPAPTSSTLGPRSRSGYIRQCYQHSPQGALMAAANITVVSWSVPEQERATSLTALITPGPGRDESIAGGTPDNSSIRIAGFRIESCAPERCNVRLVTSIGNAYGYADLSMVWVQGDWLLDGARAPSGGGLTEIPAGYTTWGV